MNTGQSFATSSVRLQKHALMEQVAHQAIVMKFILDLAQTLKVDPRGCFRQFFSKIKVGKSVLLTLFSKCRGKIKTSCGFTVHLRLQTSRTRTPSTKSWSR